MLTKLARSAHELDGWLHENWGRAYVAILGWGLVLSMLASLAVLGRALSGGRSFVPAVAVLVFQTALLVNQLAQWHELRERRRRKPGVGGVRKPAGPMGASGGAGTGEVEGFAGRGETAERF